MQEATVYQCRCPDCSAGGHFDKENHRLLNLLLARMDEDHRRLTGSPHPDRDRQFRYIEKQVTQFLRAGKPVVSVDAKKTELIGDFKNAGRSWCRQPHEVRAHDFRSEALHVAVPYGLYVVNQNRGFVTVGLSANTAEFAVDCVARW